MSGNHSDISSDPEEPTLSPMEVPMADEDAKLEEVPMADSEQVGRSASRCADDARTLGPRARFVSRF
jgi:hypothetical protein